MGRVAVSPAAVTMMAPKPKPLSPGTKNIQLQSNGFGNFINKFALASSSKKSKYGMPVFLPNGNVNPAYLAAERADMKAVKQKNIKATETKRKALIAGKKF